MPKIAEMDRPLCPKCGCPPRGVQLQALVYVDLYLGRPPRVLKQNDQCDVEYVCGGRHSWKVDKLHPDIIVGENENE